MSVTVALIQMQGHSDTAENVRKASAYVADAASLGANIVCLQELFNTAYFCYEDNPAHWELAEPLTGPTITSMRAVAAQHEIMLIAPIYEKVLAGELYNTAVVIDPSG